MRGGGESATFAYGGIDALQVELSGGVDCGMFEVTLVWGVNDR